MEDPTYRDLVDLLVKRVPELRPAFEAELERGQEPDPAVFFSAELVPFVTRLLESDRDDELLKRIFAFLEELTAHWDSRVRGLVEATILPRFEGSDILRAKARRYMGNGTLRLADEVHSYYNLNRLLVERVPELRPAYEDRLQKGEEPDPAVFFSAELVPFVTRLLESDGDDELLKRIFAFLEELTAHWDSQVRGLVEATILPRFEGSDILRAKARRYMGNGTLRLAHEVHSYYNLNRLLVERVPELRPAYEAELDWQEASPGPHVIFGDVLVPFVTRLLESDGDDELLKRIFAFLEELATSNDENVQNVVHVSVVERLMTEPLLTQARKYMGKATSHMSDVIEAWHPEGA